MALAAQLPAIGQPADGSHGPAVTETVRRPLSFAVPRGVPYQPLSSEERRRLFLRNVVLDWWDPPRATIAAAINQWRHEPEGWPQGSEGYGRRLADNYALFTIRDTMEMLGGVALRHEVRYIPSKDRKKRTRVLHALVGNFRTYNEEGEWRPHYSRITAVVASNYVAHAWRPPQNGGSTDILGGAALQLMFGAIGNVAREFQPEISRLLRRVKLSRFAPAP